jgi:putative CRISPR-associated protein (TIGR02619 family)
VGGIVYQGGIKMSYRDTLICTVGASILSNANRPNSPEQLKQLISEAQSGNITSETLRKITNPHDKTWGAEINSVASLVEKGFLDSKQKIFLLVSDTPEGNLIGNILKEYFQKNKNDLEFESVDLVKVDKLSDKNRFEFKFYGLRNLVREMANCVRGNLDRSIINATGGYKAVIAYATLLGQALSVPVYYLFETFDEIIELLPIPVKFDPNLYKDYSKIFAMLEYLNIVEEKRFLKKFGFQSWASVPEEIKIFIERIQIDKENHLSLNPLGQIYLESVEWDCSTIDDQDYKTNKSFSEKITGSGGHAISFREFNIKITEEIAKLPWVELVSITGSSEIESGDAFRVWIEKDHLKMALNSKKGTGFYVIQTTIKNQRFLECVKKKIEKILQERR